MGCYTYILKLVKIINNEFESKVLYSEVKFIDEEAPFFPDFVLINADIVTNFMEV
jgi:hypothetical protein